MMLLACGRCTCSSASERATIAMSAAMPHSSALSAFGAASAASMATAASPRRNIVINGLIVFSLFLLRRLFAGGAFTRAGGGRAAARCALHRVELHARKSAVVVPVELAEAAGPGGVARFVAGDVAVVVAIQLREIEAGAGTGGGGRLVDARRRGLRQDRRGKRRGDRQGKHGSEVHGRSPQKTCRFR